MIVIRCTARAANALKVQRTSVTAAGTSQLGDWYVNLVPTIGGGAFLFMNEQSLLAVVVPYGTDDVLGSFVGRVANVLSMVGVSNARIEKELAHFNDGRFTKTASPRLLGVLRDLGARLQETLERLDAGTKLSLSDFELGLAKMPHATLGWRTPRELTQALLDAPATYASPN